MSSTTQKMERRTVSDIEIVTFLEKELVNDKEAQALGDELVALVKQGCSKMVLNLRNVTLIGSTAIGKFLTLQKELKTVGGRLILCEIGKELAQTFRVTGFSSIFSTKEERGEEIAIKLLQVSS